MNPDNTNTAKRYNGFFAVVQYATLSFSLVELVSAWIFRSPTLGIVASLTAGLGLFFALARILLSQGHMVHSLVMAISATAIAGLLYTLMLPELLAGFMLFPLAMMGLALLGHSRRFYVGVAIFGLITSIMLSAFSLLTVPLPPIPAHFQLMLHFAIPIVITGALGLLFGYTWNNLHHSLAASQQANQALQRLQQDLEQQVAQRTSELATTLHHVQAQAAEQARLLNENEQQRQTINTLSVPILPISSSALVIPLVGTLDQERLDLLRTRALQSLEQRGARTLLLDLTGVELVDSYAASGILQLVQSAHLLGSHVILIGIRPEVAQTMVALGIDLEHMKTMADLQSALMVLG